MDEHLHDIDKLFEKAVQRHSELPTDEVWKQLEKNLQKRKVNSVTRKYKQWKWVAAVLFVFSVGLVIYTLQLTSKYKKEVKENKQNTTNLNNTNNSSFHKDNSSHLTDQKASPDSIARETEKRRRLIDSKAYKLSNDNNKPAAGKEPIADTATVNIAAENINRNKEQHTTTGLPKVHNNPGKEIQNHKVLNNQLASNMQEAKNIKEPTGHAVAGRLDNNLNKTGRKNEFLLSPVSSQELDSSTVLPGKEKMDLNLSIIREPLYSLTIKPTVIPYYKLTRSALVTAVTAKSSIRLQAKSLHPEKFTAGIFYSEHVVSTELKANRPDFREDNYMQIKSHEKNRVSTTIGLTFARKIVKNLSIASGISLATYITDITRKPLVARKDNSGKINYRISTSSGYAYYTVKNRPQPALADSIQTLSSKSTVKYVSVPLGLQYDFYLGRFVFSPAVSVYANYKSTAKIETVQSLERSYTGNLEGLKSHYFDGSLGLGIGYYLSKKIVIDLIPSARVALSTATGKNPVTTQRHSIGLAAGLNFSF